MHMWTKHMYKVKGLFPFTLKRTSDLNWCVVSMEYLKSLLRFELRKVYFSLIDFHVWDAHADKEQNSKEYLPIPATRTVFRGKTSSSVSLIAYLHTQKIAE